MMTMIRHLSCGALPAALLVVITGCGADRAPAASAGARDTLPNGALRVSFGSLPASAADTAAIDLSIGSLDGPEHEVFGDVRGVEAAPDGTIYILDYQASEVRLFNPDGSYRGLLARRGEGPGEIREANGFVLADDGTLWIQDHGQWQMIGIGPEGEEVSRFPMPVRSYGYIWNGTLDDRGRFWKPESHSTTEQPRTYPPETGVQEYGARAYLKVYDPATEASDSVYLGEASGRSHISQNSMGGYSYRGIPFDPRPITVVDPEGGFWTTDATAYRIARLDEAGDTVMVIEADIAPLPITDADRQAYVDAAADREPADRRIAEEIAGLMLETKPIIDQMLVDDQGLLWVRRVGTEGDLPLYDVFDRDGNHRGSVRLGFQPAGYFTPRIRDDRLYVVVRDELDVPTVVRAPLPDLGGPAT